MSKPVIRLEEISYEVPHDPNGREYPVFVINGAHKAPYVQGSICCTGCGGRHHYRWEPSGPWVQIKCPTCGSISAWWEEYHDDEEAGEEEA